MNGPAAKGQSPHGHIYLVDGSGFLFRAYHALPPLTRKSDGLPTGAVSGYCNMLWKLLEDMRDGDQPTHVAVIFDAAKRTFRNDIYPDYKAQRPEPPDDLIPQFALVREATRAFGIPSIEQTGFEADDLIASYARQAREAGMRVTIVSSDKDLMQLVVDGAVELFDTMKNKRIGTAEVLERFGVPPAKVVEVQALAGDAVDNVPGVRGIGVKTAAELINAYGDLENLLAHAEEIKQPKRRQNLIDGAELARVSRRLVALDDHVDLPVPLAQMHVHEPEPTRLIGFLKAMEFATLTRRAATHFGILDSEAIPPGPDPAGQHAQSPEPASVGDDTTQGPLICADQNPGGKPGAVMDRGALLRAISYEHYECVTTVERLAFWLRRAYDAGRVCVDTETTSLDPMQASLCGVSLCVAPGEACYIPCGHRHAAGLDLAAQGAIHQLPEHAVLAALKPLLVDPGVLKIAQNMKYDYLIFARRGLHVTPFDDTMLMSYVLDSALHGHGMDELSALHLQHTPISFKEVTGRGKDKIGFEQVSLESATRYAAEDADVTFRLHGLLKARLIGEGKQTVYETLERPLVAILADMEEAGIAIAADLLRRLSNEFANEMLELERHIHQAAGQSFNLASPKQLGDVLFGTLGLPGGKKTKTGAWSTDADTLETLASAGHEIAQKILDWRQLAKLRGTYTDALPGYVNRETGRVHTSFAMASTSTGRLASSDPNLQNIPIRTAAGRKIRTAFIAPPGKLLLSADYSQIELRLLAHIADIGALKTAFARGIDIHAMTASEVFGVPVEGMPADIRRRAKAINFGIVYGISGFGLANQLGIERDEANAYIRRYFERFPGIRTYMDRTKELARAQGFVETLFGRRIHIREIASKVPGLRAGAERAAINAPIQGSAADIIRRAMIRLPEALAQAGMSARMLLQVHDELVFEVPEAEAEASCALIARIMERAALPAIELSVPLVVEAHAAANWDAAH